MMLDDLRLLLAHTSPIASREDYARAVVDDNVLGKATRKTRELTFKYLATLYGLNPDNPIFRALLRLWSVNEAAQPVLALSVALARDPLLRGTQKNFLSLPVGAKVQRENVEVNLGSAHAERFSVASLKSLAQNIAGTWTSAGLLQGRAIKVRQHLQPHPESVAMLLFLGYLEGRTGQRLFTSDWTNLFTGSSGDLETMASSASHRGLLVFMNAGGVKEVRFPGYLTLDEEKIREELLHVI
jgi:hypothetical protein